MASSVTWTSLNPSSTADIVSTYVPPFATGVTYTAHSRPATSFTGIPTGFASATITSFPSEPTTPAFADNVSWVFAYLTIHSLSMTSMRYTYILWIILGLMFVILSVLHWTGARGGWLGALWTKWALRRRTVRKKHGMQRAAAAAADGSSSKNFKQPEALPSNSQFFTMTVLTVVVLALCTVGPDYINPNIGIFRPTYNHDARGARSQFLGNANPNAVRSAFEYAKRAAQNYNAGFDPNVILLFFAPQFTISKTVWTSAARFGDFAFALLPLCVLFALKAPPFAVLAWPWGMQIHFDKLVRMHRWTGWLINVLVVVHIALWSVQLAKDNRTSTTKKAWTYVFQYDKFRYGWTAFLALTLLNILSIRTIRKRHYELFYVAHILLVPTVLFFSAFHHPPVWWWCWIAIGLWFGERMYRAVCWLRLNGYIMRGRNKNGAVNQPPSPITPDQEAGKYSFTAEKPPQYAPGQVPGAAVTEFVYPPDKARPKSNASSITAHIPPTAWRGRSSYGKGQEAWEMAECKSPASPDGSERDSLALHYQNLEALSSGQQTPVAPVAGGSQVDLRAQAVKRASAGEQPPSPGPQQQSHPLMNSNAANPYASSVTTSGSRGALPIMLDDGSTSNSSSYLPPPGYAHCTLLPGHTVRIRLLTPGHVSWAPGQNFLLNIPAIHRATTHPFSVSSVHDAQSAAPAGRALVLLVRARSGWTKRLWDEVSRLVARGETIPAREMLKYPMGAEHPPVGVVMRAYVEGPFGSAVRARWGSHSTVLIIAGGSGVSFGLSVLEYVTLCMAGRDGKFLGGQPGGWNDWSFKTSRVRFVWMVREYSHIQWGASSIRRCMSLVPGDALEISIYVSNFKIPSEPAYLAAMSMYFGDDSQLAPPVPQFARKSKRGSELSLESSDAESSIAGSDVDLTYANGDGERRMVGELANELGHEAHVLDYTNFDGEDDTALPGERNLSRKLKKVGTVRRAKTRRLQRARSAKQEPPPSTFRKHASVQSMDGLISPTSPRPASTWSEDERWRAPGNPRTGDFDSASPTPYAESVNVFEASFKGQGAKRRPPASFMLSGHDSDSASSRVQSTYDLRESGIGGGRLRESYIQGGEVAGVVQDSQEIRDMTVVSEAARAGKPKLDHVLASEISRAKGPMIVGCCGPKSLNAVMRKVIAAQIDPAAIRRGDMRSSITFVSEDFEY